jgi:hypothetical protein
MRPVEFRGSLETGRAETGRTPVKILSAAAGALCAALAAYSAPAQEGAATGAPAGGDATLPAGVTPGEDAAVKGKAPEPAAPAGDIELLAPRRAPVGLWRRANLKTLIANAPGRTTLPAGTSGVDAWLLRRPALPVPALPLTAPRNAVGLAVASAPGRGVTGSVTPHIPVPVSGVTRHAAAINGTGLNRPSGIIGGPATDRSGINGTRMRPRS